MSIDFTASNPSVCQIILNSVDTEAEINLVSLTGPREFVIGDNSIFGAAKLYIDRYISDNTDWTRYKSPETGEIVEFTESMAGPAMAWLHKAGKIRFIIEDADEDTDIRIDLFK